MADHGERIEDRAKFRAMTEGTQEDWMKIAAHFGPFATAGGKRVLDHLRLLDGDYGGFPVDRLTHSLQTATRAHRDGRDEEYVVCALLHDIGDTLGAFNHPDIAAAIVKPFVAPENHWMVEKHGLFQGHYFFHYLGMDRNVRDQFRGHPNFERTAEFCEKYDQTAFDPEYDTMPLEAFESMVMNLFAAPKSSVYSAVADR
jgi:predicted HD phosphohydrolase